MKRRKFITYQEYLPGGSEGKIFIAKEGVYKKFHPTLSLTIRRRKKEILLYLEKLKELDPYYPEIRYLVESFFMSYLKGYIMQPIVGGEINSTSYNCDEKLKALQDLKNIIALFRKYGLFYFDIRHPNIKIDNNHNPILLDIDSLLFEGEHPDATPYFMQDYIRKSGKLDEHAQILMFNRLTLTAFQQFDLENYFDIDNDGSEIITDSKMFDSPYDHEYLIDHMKIKTR